MTAQVHRQDPHPLGICKVMLAGVLALTLPIAAHAQTSLGAFEKQIDGIGRVSAVAYDADGILHALDADAGVVRTFGDNGEPIGTIQIGSGPLIAATGLAIGDRGVVYISEAGKHRVLMRRDDGEIITLSTLGHRDGRVHTPSGLDVRGTKLVVADTGNSRVQFFDIYGDTADSTLVRTGDIDWPFSAPVDVAIHGPTGRVFVTDRETHRVYRFSSTGRIEMHFGGFGDAPGLLNTPTGIDIKGDRVYVTDSRNHRVQVYDTEGYFVEWWGLHTAMPHEGGGKLHYPDSIALHPSQDRVAVGEAFEDRVQLFGPATPESIEAQALDRAAPRGVSGHFGPRIDADGDLLAVIEPETARVLVYETSGDVPLEITRLGGFGRGFGRFVSPAGVAVDAANQRVYVADEATGHVSLFELDRDPDASVRFSPTMGRLVRSTDVRRSAMFIRAMFTWDARPVACELRDDGKLDILEAANGQIVTLDENMEVDSVRGFLGFGDVQLSRPYDFTRLEDGRFAVTEPSTGRILIVGDSEWDADILRIEGAEGARPAGIQAYGHGLLVTDFSTSRVLSIEPDGTITGASGGPERGLGPDRYFRPAGLTVSEHGLFVCDHGNHRIIIREPDTGVGVFRRAFGPFMYTDPANKPGRTGGTTANED